MKNINIFYRFYKDLIKKYKVKPKFIFQYNTRILNNIYEPFESNYFNNKWQKYIFYIEHGTSVENLFITFLEENDAYCKFISNINKDVYSYVKNTNDTDSLILHAFTWSNTNEGTYYWHKLSDKWETICRIKKYDFISNLCKEMKRKKIMC